MKSSPSKYFPFFSSCRFLYLEERLTLPTSLPTAPEFDTSTTTVLLSAMLLQKTLCFDQSCFWQRAPQYTVCLHLEHLKCFSGTVLQKEHLCSSFAAVSRVESFPS